MNNFLISFPQIERRRLGHGRHAFVHIVCEWPTDTFGMDIVAECMRLDWLLLLTSNSACRGEQVTSMVFGFNLVHFIAHKILNLPLSYGERVLLLRRHTPIQTALCKPFGSCADYQNIYKWIFNEFRPDTELIVLRQLTHTSSTSCVWFICFHDSGVRSTTCLADCAWRNIFCFSFRFILYYLLWAICADLSLGRKPKV